ncbi:MAG: hypothetical protein IJT83_10020 [Victivallales bacterium]|nr:hypothetical protein [Victivallales bacterium]
MEPQQMISDRDAVVRVTDALDMVYEFVTSSESPPADSVVQDFCDIIVHMAGARDEMPLRELTNAMQNFGSALEEGDYSILSMPRGLRVDRIVSVEEFVESKFFMGQRGYVRPRVLEKLVELFHGPNADDNLEVVLGGGIGWGKSYFSEMAIAYMLYKLSCYYSPQIEYGLAPGSSIYFVMQSIKQELAKKVLYGQFSSRLRSSEYFRKYFPFAVGVMSELRFPNNIFILPLSSSDTSALGLNVFGGVLDELNFMARVTRKSASRLTGTQEYDQAAVLYSTIMRRMKSRFSVRGRVPGKLMLVSSANYPGDFIDRKIKEAAEERLHGGRTTIFVVRMAQWESMPKDRVSEETFLVEVGDETRNSRMINRMEDATDTESVIEVPVDYQKEFERDLEASIRDLAGIPIGGISAFIKKRETIELAAQTHARMFDAHQLFVEGTIDLSHYDGRLLRLIDSEYLEQLSEQPITFFVSVDLALTGDSCGFAIGHFAGLKAVGKSTNWDEEQRRYVEMPAGEVPCVCIDGLLEIVPPAVDEIDISLIGDLVELLNARLVIEGVSADSFQSAALLQRMRKLRNLHGRRIRAGVLSVDTSPAPYNEVKQALRDGRLIFPNFLKVKKELRELIRDPRTNRIDHPLEGSKDVSDALAACTYLLVSRNSVKNLKGTAGRRILEGIDAPEEDYVQHTPRVRPRGSGHRVH